MLTLRIFAISLLLAATGCSTVIVQRAQGAATAGKTYVTALKEVNAMAVTKSLDFNANMLAEDTIRSKATLEGNAKQQQNRIKVVEESSAFLSKLSEYFAGLEALAKGDVSAEVGDGLGAIADTLKKEPFGVKLSDDRKAAFTGLAAYVAKQVHAAAVTKALDRDADTVARAIALSDEMLEVVGGWIHTQELLVGKKVYLERVEAPFVEKKQLGSDWKASWIAHVRGPGAITVIKDAKSASAEMQKAWKSVLTGQYSFDEVIVALKNVQAGIDALAAAKSAK